MASPFATLDDLKKHWPGLPAEDEEEAEQKLAESSLIIRQSFKTIDARITRGELDKDLVKLVACRMVRRALDVPDDVPEGADQMSFAAGPYSESFHLRNTDGAVYLGKQDLRLLQPEDTTGKFFNLMPR